MTPSDEKMIISVVPLSSMEHVLANISDFFFFLFKKNMLDYLPSTKQQTKKNLQLMS